MADSPSTENNYGPAVKCGRDLARRALPPHVRAVHVELQRYARAPRAISDGVEWVAVPRTLLKDAAASLWAGWCPDRRETDQPTFRLIPDRRQARSGVLSGSRRDDDPQG